MRFSAPKKSVLKEYGLETINGVLESAYWAIVDYKAEATADTAVKAMKAIHAVLFRMGGIETMDDGSHRPFLYAEEWHLFMNLVSVTTSSKKVFLQDGERLDVTSFSAFKSAFWNAYYLKVTGHSKLFNLSTRKAAAAEKFAKKTAAMAAAEKKAAEEAAAAEKKEAEEAANRAAHVREFIKNMSADQLKSLGLCAISNNQIVSAMA